jgi:hypothetical protein
MPVPGSMAAAAIKARENFTRVLDDCRKNPRAEFIARVLPDSKSPAHTRQEAARAQRNQPNPSWCSLSAFDQFPV